MNKINGVEQNEFVFSAALKINEEVIKLASQYEGRVYGTYVRNVIVPRLKDPLCVCEYDTIAIEFVDQKELDEFSKQLELNYKDMTRKTKNGAKMYQLYIQGMFIAYIRLCLTTPTYRFDVNCLVYYYENDIPTLFDQLDCEFLTLTDCSTKTLPLIELIHSKVATASKLVVDTFLTDSDIIDHINEFLRRGWTVIFGTHQLKEVITINDLVALTTPKKSVMDEYMALQSEITILQNQLNDMIIKRDAALIKCLQIIK